MKSRLVILSLAVLLGTVVTLGLPKEARAEKVYCFCYDEVSRLDQNNYKTLADSIQSSQLRFCTEPLTISVEQCADGKIDNGEKKYDHCKKVDNIDYCKDEQLKWFETKQARIKASAEYQENYGGAIGAILPSCVNTERGCRDVGAFVLMGINLSNYLFGIIGALALLMFIYGGFTFVLSGGNPEKVKKGSTILVSAVIGLVIAFGAYALVRFLGSTFLEENGQYVLR